MRMSTLERFDSRAKRPDDFDAFWKETQARTNAVSLDARLTPSSLRSTDEVEVFEASYRSYRGLRIAGWYARPRHRSEPLPAILVVPGYAGEPKLPSDVAALGYAVFSAAPRGKLRSNSAFNPGYPGLLTHNITDRDTYGYRGFYMDAVRAFDLLAGLPEVDRRRVGVRGTSQGGALTLLVSALRAGRVRAAAAGAPYLCSIMDSTSLTRTYPYEEINDYLRLYPDRTDAVREVLAYYDIQNFVDRIRCPIILNVGLNDPICPPETGFAVFRAIGSAEKRLYPYENCAHDAGSSVGHEEVTMEFLAEKLRP